MSDTEKTTTISKEILHELYAIRTIYLEKERKRKERLKKYHNSEKGLKSRRECAKRRYWRKTVNLFHPIYNPDCPSNGKKFYYYNDNNIYHPVWNPTGIQIPESDSD